MSIGWSLPPKCRTVIFQNGLNIQQLAQKATIPKKQDDSERIAASPQDVWAHNHADNIENETGHKSYV